MKYQMEKFEYFFGVSLASLIFGHSDNLSKTLQHTYISAVEGQSVAKMSVKTLEVMRSDTQFDLFWSKVLREASRLDVDDPTLLEKGNVPLSLNQVMLLHFQNPLKITSDTFTLAPWILLLLALNHDLINQDMKYIAK